MKSPRNPLPSEPDKFLYWVAAAIAGAIMGGLVYSYLSRNDPI